MKEREIYVMKKDGNENDEKGNVRIGKKKRQSLTINPHRHLKKFSKDNLKYSVFNKKIQVFTYRFRPLLGVPYFLELTDFYSIS